MQIEDFAKEKLLSAVSDDHLVDDSEMEKALTEYPSSVNAITKDGLSEVGQPCTSESIQTSSITDAQRCMSLYFALCTKLLYQHHHVFLQSLNFFLKILIICLRFFL